MAVFQFCPRFSAHLSQKSGLATPTKAISSEIKKERAIVLQSFVLLDSEL